MNLRDNMTEISGKQWDYLEQENMTPQEIVAYLQSEHQVRTFASLLTQMYPDADLEQRLVEEFQSPRTVSNWLKNRNLPAKREEVFRIAFTLKLTEGEVNRLLEYVFDQGIHYRNEKEVIYAYALKNHADYDMAKHNAELFQNRHIQSLEKGSEQEGMKTGIVKLEFDEVAQDEDFMSFLMRHSVDFGNYHNTSYHYFTSMMELLRGSEENEEAYSVAYITEHYLRMHVPEVRDTKGYTQLQRFIKKYWPGVRSVKAMLNRKEDVTRKVLILLYLVIGGEYGKEYDSLDEADTSSVDMLLVHSTRLNHMLEECGMRGIDPRDSFDYLALYCLKVEQGEAMSDRMEQVVQELFMSDETVPSYKPEPKTVPPETELRTR